MGNMNLKLKDCILENLDYDTDSWGGCETCDFGSRYINILYFKFSDEEEIKKLEIRNQYNLLMSESDLMQTICNANSEMTKQDLINSIIDKVKEVEESYDETSIYINDELTYGEE